MVRSADGSPRTFSTRVDLPTEQRTKLIELLNQHLADATDLHSQFKQAHWNVKGRHFFPLHELFDEIARELGGYVDELAERVTALGGYALGTVRMAAQASGLPEYPTHIDDGLDHVSALAERLGLFANRVRQAIDQAASLGDASTADLFTEISRTADKRLWFLEAHLQGGT
jgi:starvation-inducible DNA-binding protein